MRKVSSVRVLIGLLLVASTTVSGMGRDEVSPYIGLRSSAAFWVDHGMGGWRTHDESGHVVQRDWGFSLYDLGSGFRRGNEGFSHCRAICGFIPQCRGVEFRTVGFGTSPARLVENGITYHYNKCEIHYDPFAACERSASTPNTNPYDQLDGCWTKVGSPVLFGHFYPRP